VVKTVPTTQAVKKAFFGVPSLKAIVKKLVLYLSCNDPPNIKPQIYYKLNGANNKPPTFVGDDLDYIELRTAGSMLLWFYGSSGSFWIALVELLCGPLRGCWFRCFLKPISTSILA
jgi:hypothetical protein